MCRGCERDLRLPPGADGRCGYWKPGVAKFLHQLQLACRVARHPKADPAIVLRFDDCEETAHTEYILVVNSSHVSNRLSAATIVRMVPVVPGSAQPPFLVRYDCEEVPTGLWPRIGSETDLARRLLAMSPRWEM